MPGQVPTVIPELSTLTLPGLRQVVGVGQNKVIHRNAPRPGTRHSVFRRLPPSYLGSSAPENPSGGLISTSAIGSNFDSSNGGRTGSWAPSVARCVFAAIRPQW